MTHLKPLAFNRTKLELKFFSWPVLAALGGPFNRTKLELK